LNFAKGALLAGISTPEATAAAPIADIDDHPGEPGSSISANGSYWDVATID
jgi:hypothetical protein